MVLIVCDCVQRKNIVQVNKIIIFNSHVFYDAQDEGEKEEKDNDNNDINNDDDGDADHNNSDNVA